MLVVGQVVVRRKNFVLRNPSRCRCESHIIDVISRAFRLAAAGQHAFKQRVQLHRVEVVAADFHARSREPGQRDLVLREQRGDFVGHRVGALQRHRQRQRNRRQQFKLPPVDAAAAGGDFQISQQVKLHERVVDDGSVVAHGQIVGFRLGIAVFVRHRIAFRRVGQNARHGQIAAAGEAVEINAAALAGERHVKAELHRAVSVLNAGAGRAGAGEGSEEISLGFRRVGAVVLLDDLRVRAKRRKNRGGGGHAQPSGKLHGSGGGSVFHGCCLQIVRSVRVGWGDFQASAGCQKL